MQHNLRRCLTGMVGAMLVLGVAGCAVQPSPPPRWPTPTGDVRAYARSAGLAILPAEGNVLHIHAHLTVTVDGHRVQVPARIGIDARRGLYSEIHTHDTSGILHVESAHLTTFYLAQPLREWDIALKRHGIAGYQDGVAGARVTLFVGGKPYPGDFRKLVLRNRQDIVLAVTTDGTEPRATAAYHWPKGY